LSTASQWLRLHFLTLLLRRCRRVLPILSPLRYDVEFDQCDAVLLAVGGLLGGDERIQLKDANCQFADLGQNRMLDDLLEWPYPFNFRKEINDAQLCFDVQILEVFETCRVFRRGGLSGRMRWPRANSSECVKNPRNVGLIEPCAHV
jgi:hypothetical protein